MNSCLGCLTVHGDYKTPSDGDEFYEEKETRWGVAGAQCRRGGEERPHLGYQGRKETAIGRSGSGKFLEEETAWTKALE